MLSEVKRFLVGTPLSNVRAHREKLTKKRALVTFSSDVLSSVAYATEAILIVLAGAPHAFSWAWPLTLVIVGLLCILVLSYHQTIGAYPEGGGAYTVSRENLGTNMGLLAAAALIIDYILTVAVSISAGTDAVASAFPQLLPYKILIASMTILLLVVLNLRGIRESGVLFSVPTYLFIFSLLAMFVRLGYDSSLNPLPATVPLMPDPTHSVGSWLILVAFAHGCTALTGVEAISSGVMSFQAPEQKNAKKTLIWMALILATLFMGVTFFSHIYGITPKADETVISQLARHLNNSFFYYLIQAATAGILLLAANTSFNDFPRLASLLADDRFVPRQMAAQGDRLVFSNGVLGLGLIASGLVFLFKANVEHLLPMYAIGVFLSFSLSQAAMVKHWHQEKTKHWLAKALINGVGCVATATALIVIVITKFAHGGWVICTLIPLFVLWFRRIKHHYLVVGRQLRVQGEPPVFPKISVHKIILPVSGLHKGVLSAMTYARSLNGEISACYIDIQPRITQRLIHDWEQYGMGIPLNILPSPYRSVIRPILDYVDQELKKDPRALITLVIPEFVNAKWRHRLLHNQTALFIRAALTFKKRVIITSVRYHLSS